jgi:hypothetical protein
MDEHINSVLIQFLDVDTKYQYLKYYYLKMIAESYETENENDIVKICFDKLDNAYEQWQDEKRLLEWEAMKKEPYVISFGKEKKGPAFNIWKYI